MPPPPTPRLAVRDLTKEYGPLVALGGVSFDVAPGEIVGLLGLNGAGKTTCLECILGLREPEAGSIEVDGIDARVHPGRARQRVGAQLQVAALQDKITPREALRLFASFHPGASAADSLLRQFQLVDKADYAFDTLSGGQRQRLFLALALVNHPQLVILDEPTAGLDPQARRELHQLILRLKTEGRSILLSTHDLEEARQLCDRVGILHAGRLIALDTPAGLIARSTAAPRLFFRTARALDAAAFGDLPGIGKIQQRADGWLLDTPDTNQALGVLAGLMARAQNELLDLSIHRPSLEDVFLELTGQAWSLAAEGTP